MKVKSGYVSVPTPEGEMEVYFSHPREFLRAPVLIVFQEAFGVNGHIQDVCHRFAHEGYYVLAPELFHRLGKHILVEYSDRPQVMKLLKEMTAEQISTDIQALLDYLPGIEHIDRSQIATVGFCIGGYTSLLAAARFNLSTAIAFYGAGTMKPREGIGLAPLKDEFKNISCPLLLFFGEQDASIPVSEVHEMEQELEKHEKVFRSVIFPNANHGFFCNQRGSFNSAVVHQAWDMSLEWLMEHLHSVGSTAVGSRVSPSAGASSTGSVEAGP